MNEKVFDYGMERDYQLERENVRQLADQVFVFCPNMEIGIMFYDQSPAGPIAKLVGSLPKGKYWSSGEDAATWKEELNGKRNNQLVVDNETSLLVERKIIKVNGGASFKVSTIMVSEDNFNDLISQIDNPTYASQQNYESYKVLNINSKIIDITNNKENEDYEENIDNEINDYIRKK